MGVLKVPVGSGWRKVGCHRTSPETFTYNGTDGTDGSVQHFLVPDGVTQITVTLDGAEGGPSGNSHVAGGKGARLVTTLAVTPDEVLELRIGGSRAPSGFGFGDGGYNGGGTGGHGGAAGGGATDIRRGSTILGIAAGGGGAGDAAAGEGTGAGGDGGGTTGQNGHDGAATYGTAGLGGTPSTGGAAGTPTSTSGTAGSSLHGGAGGHDASLGDYGGGGGGGGLFGGGGGGRGATDSPFGVNHGAGGGAGGSSYSSGTATTHTRGVHTGHGAVSISWDPPAGRLRMQLADGTWLRETCPGEVGRPVKAIIAGVWTRVLCMRPVTLPSAAYDDAGGYDLSAYT